MNMLKSVERKLEGLVEGLFGRAFKASVQPVELAHKLAKEMGDHKTLGVSSVYVPNEYEIYLGHDDHEKLSALGDALKTELANYLTAFARREGWTMVAPPRIELLEDADLRLGEFGIATRTVTGAADAEARAVRRAGARRRARAPPRAASRPSSASAVAAPLAAGPSPAQTVLYERPAAAAARYALRGPGVDVELSGAVIVIGRSRRCDVVLDRPERLPAARRGAAHRRPGGPARPRFDERHARQPARRDPDGPAAGRPHRDRYHRAALREALVKGVAALARPCARPASSSGPRRPA